MQDISLKRCRNHQFREAVARCPECEGYFCRECVTEHEDRVLCASCLKKIHQSADRRMFHFNAVRKMLQFVIGGTVIWIFFFYLGQLLISFPDSFHDGTLWQTKWWDQP